MAELRLDHEDGLLFITRSFAQELRHYTGTSETQTSFLKHGSSL